MGTNFAVAPGEYLQEWIDGNGMSVGEFAVELGVTVAEIEDLLTGKEAIGREIACQLERVTSIPSDSWIRFELKYREDLKRMSVGSEESCTSSIHDELASLFRQGGRSWVAGFALWHAAVPTSIKLLSEDSEVAESHSLASLKTGSHLDGKAALSFGYLTEQDEYVVMMRQDDGGYRRKSYPADGTVVYEDAEADDARVEVVDQYVVIRETHEFPIVGEWTRDRRKFLKCEIRIHVPAGSIAQGEYDIT